MLLAIFQSIILTGRYYAFITLVLPVGNKECPDGCQWDDDTEGYVLEDSDE